MTMPLFDDLRAAWGAAPSTLTAAQYRANTVAPSARVGVSYHYPGASSWTITPASDHARCLTYIRAWQRQHFTQGWNDLGYNAVICQHARAIEGRNVDQKGSHSPGVNWTHYGVQLMVANDAAPTAAMYARAARLHADLTARSGHSLRAWGHRDDPEASTACPGDHIEAWVKSGGPLTANLSNTVGRLPATPVPEEDEVTPEDIDKIALAVWGYKNAEVNGKRDTYRLLTDTLTKADGFTLRNDLAWQNRTFLAQFGALTGAIAKLSEGQALTADQIIEASRQGASQALATLDAEVTLKPAADGKS
jgi:hypothetical protein